MSKRSLFVPVMGFVLIAALLSPGVASAQSPPAEKISFRIGTLEDLVTTNAFKASGGTDYEYLFMAYDMLYNFGQQDLAAVSGLAYWPPEHSADHKTWTFKIRTGVKWSDGVPLTAKDVAFTYNLINDRDLGSFSQELGVPIEHNAFEAPDDTTLIWRMEEPSITPEHPPWIPILPEHIWGKYVDTEKYDNQDIHEFSSTVGSGPFVLKEWTPGQHFTMTANKGYWGGAPHIDEVLFRVYDNAEAMKLALVNGEIDAADGFPPAVFESLLNQPNIVTNAASPRYWGNLAFNFEGTADPSLQNLKVRQAIEHSIDKQAIVDRVFLGYGSVGTTIINPVSTRWHWEPAPDELIGYDPGAAKSLLDDAGYKDADGDGLRETPNGDAWQLEVLTITDWSSSVPEGKLIAGWMNDIGIKTSVKAVTSSKATDLWWAQDFDMYVWGWGVAPDPNWYLSVFISDQCLNWSDGCWKDPVYDRMYEQQTTAVDYEKRHEIVDQMQQYLYEQIPEVVLTYESGLQAYRNDRFTGFVNQPEPNGLVFYAWSPWSYLSIRPVEATSAGGGGIPAGLLVGLIVALVAVAVVIAVFVAVRRRKNWEADE